MPLPGDLARRLKSALDSLGGRSAYVPLTSNELDLRLHNGIIASVIVHMVLIFGLTFQAANPALFQNFDALEVVLVNARSQSQPLDADVLAQHNLDGGGEVDEDRQAKTPLPASDQDAPASAAALESQIRALEAQAKLLMTQARSDQAVARERPDPVDQPKPPLPTSLDLVESSLEQARLMARISEDYDAYQKRPRRDDAHSRAKEYAFTRYVEDWRAKIERVGNLNYPEAAKRGGIHGYLVLTVEIRADGSLEKVEIDHSSGSRILDAAAVKIVQMSAPFAPFSAEMRKKVDLFSITRTWHFTNNDELFSK